MKITRSAVMLLLAVACVFLVPLMVYSKLRFKQEPSELEQAAYNFTPVQFEVTHKTWQNESLQLPFKAVASPAAVKSTAVQPAASLPPTLSFILQDGDKSMAIINGTMVKTGSEVRGWTVERIERNRVLLRNPKGTIWLKLD